MTVRDANDQHEQGGQAARQAALAAAVHELRAPLTTIRGFLETLLRRGDGLSSQERTRMIEVALRNAVVLGDRVGALLDDTTTARDVAAVARPTRLRDAVEAIVEDCAGTLAGREVAVEVDPATWVLADGRALAHVLSNLLENAAKYDTSGRPIVVRATEGLDDVRVEVVDRGQGIDPADLPHVFEPFHRGHHARAGTGLGLAVVRRLVEAWGGRVHVESVRGTGTTVAFTLAPVPVGARPPARQ